MPATLRRPSLSDNKFPRHVFKPPYSALSHPPSLSYPVTSCNNPLSFPIPSYLLSLPPPSLPPFLSSFPTPLPFRSPSQAFPTLDPSLSPCSSIPLPLSLPSPSCQPHERASSLSLKTRDVGIARPHVSTLSYIINFSQKNNLREET